MATTKKAPVKKSTTKKIAAKTVAKAVTKKKAAKKTAEMKSFRVYPNTQPFVVFQITRQTFYWTILLLFIILIQVWILKIQFDIIDLSSQISAGQ